MDILSKFFIIYSVGLLVKLENVLIIEGMRVCVSNYVRRVVCSEITTSTTPTTHASNNFNNNNGANKTLLR